MAQPSFIPLAFAANGDRNTIPEESSSAASWTQGFPPITALPLSSGGIAPDRKDFNGIFHALAEHAVFEQVGGIWEYSAEMDYETPAIVGYNGQLYYCVRDNGKTSGTVISPADDESGTYWQQIEFGGGSGIVIAEDSDVEADLQKVFGIVINDDGGN